MITQKQALYKRIKRKLEQTGDKLGRPIDPLVFETVLYFNLLGIETAASCEGHLDHGVAAPWVDFNPKETLKYKQLQKSAEEKLKKAEDTRGRISRKVMRGEIFKEYTDTLQEISVLLKNDIEPVLKLLNEFYKEHVCIYEHMLVFRNVFQFTRLTFVGEFMQDARTKAEKKKELHLYQQELKEFTLFLRRKFEGN